MPEDMYKAMVGWKLWDSEKDQKHEPTHKLLTNEEYRDLVNKINSLKTELATEQKTHEDDVVSIKIQAASQISKEKQNAQISIDIAKAEAFQMIQEAQEETEKYKKAYSKEKDLNTNLIKVARERGNKARKLPKKGESYIVQDKFKYDVKSIEKWVDSSGKNTVTKTSEHHNEAWKIKISTPWDCSLQEKEIDKLVMDDVRTGKLKVYDDRIQWYDENPTHINYNHFEKTTLIIQRIYYCNVKTGFWEVTFVMNVEPTVEPTHRGSRYV